MKLSHKLKLSFCITCKNRFYQIKKTLPENLKDNCLDENIIEFILVDFDSEDGLQDWVTKEFTPELKSGYLKYYHTDGLPFWHASIAKNTSHYYANNDIVTNLDCDNYTGYRGGRYLIDLFCENKNIITHQYNSIDDGCYGRISVLKKYFEKIGGYDENFEPMGYQDIDLIMRLKLLGLKYLRLNSQEYCKAELNTKKDSIKYTNSNMIWHEMDYINMKQSTHNINCGNIVANNETYGIRTATIYKS